MSLTFPLSLAPSPFAELIARLAEGDEVVLTKDDVPVAVVTRRTTETSWPSEPGSAKQYRFWMADDFNDPIDDVGEIFP